MTQADLIAALPEGRLPPSLLDLGAADLLALFGLGLVLAALVAILALPLLDRKPSLRARVRATRGLPAEERMLEIARILGHLPPDLQAAAYRGEVVPDAVIERLALKAGRRR